MGRGLKRWWWLVVAFGVVAAVPFMGLGILSGLAQRPTDLGIGSGSLRGCPPTPNCVSSTEPADGPESQYIAPLEFEGSSQAAWDALPAVLNKLPRTAVVTQTDNYIHVESWSTLFRFFDDVEFHLRENPARIEMRSASRVGRSDLGVNRARLDRIREMFRLEMTAEAEEALRSPAAKEGVDGDG